MGKAFLDTSIIVYANDARAPDQQERAIAVVLSEDLNPGQLYAGMQVHNPFGEGP